MFFINFVLPFIFVFIPREILPFKIFTWYFGVQGQGCFTAFTRQCCSHRRTNNCRRMLTPLLSLSLSFSLSPSLPHSLARDFIAAQGFFSVCSCRRCCTPFTRIQIFSMISFAKEAAQVFCIIQYIRNHWTTVVNLNFLNIFIFSKAN